MITQSTGRKAKIAILALIVVVFGGLYVYHLKKVTELESAAVGAQQAGTVYSTEVSGLTLTLYKSGDALQTLTLGEDAAAGMNLISGSTIDTEPFITTDDVNFDGHPDVAMLTGIGYGGVNAFYDYYIFDPSTEQFVKSAVLTSVGNPVFDRGDKTITGDARDAQDSFKTVYSWNGSAYVKGPTISDTTGQTMTED